MQYYLFAPFGDGVASLHLTTVGFASLHPRLFEIRPLRGRGQSTEGAQQQ
jgi:hypothetical protein